MKKYIISRTEAENNYNYTGEWDSDFLNDYVEADSEEEAIEFAKDWIQEHSGEPDNYIYRAEER